MKTATSRGREEEHCVVSTARSVGVYVGATAIFMALTWFLYPILNELIEHHIFKGHILHTFWRSKGLEHETWTRQPDDPLVMFLHVPRTSGDAMATHLFGPIANVKSKIWTHEYRPTLRASFDGTTFLAETNRLGVAMQKVESANGTRQEVAVDQQMIKGYFNRKDLLAVQPHTRSFVFLRDPVERLLSFFHFQIDRKGQLSSETVNNEVRMPWSTSRYQTAHAPFGNVIS